MGGHAFEKIIELGVKGKTNQPLAQKEKYSRVGKKKKRHAQPKHDWKVKGEKLLFLGRG